MSRNVRWLVIAGVYALALVFLVALIVGQDDAAGRTMAIEAAVFVGVPAAAFAGAALPLWRASRNRLWLAAAGIVSFLVAVVVAVVTWGIALPVSCGLVALAIADFDRVLTLSGWRGNRRAVAFAVALLIGGALVGLAAPLAVVVAIAGVAILLWKLVATRPRRT
jgi:hypothetical protein